MKYLIIDDNETFAKQLFKQLTGNESNSEHDTLKPSTETLNVFAESIKSIINANDDVVLCINVNLELAKDSRQLQKGIELLIWLRIKGVMNHCVLYSFETFHTLLNRKHEHLIAASLGTSFFQMPDKFRKIDYSKLHQNIANKEDIKKTLKAIFDSGDKGDIIKYKHRGANWWGIKALCEVYKVVEAPENFNYPPQIEVELLNLNNAIVKFIYELEETKIQSIINQERISREKNIDEIKPKLVELENKLEEIELEEIIGLEDLEKIKNNIAYIQRSLSTYYSADLIDERKKLLETKTLIEEQLTEIKHGNLLIETAKNQIDENLKTLNKEIENILTTLKISYENSSKYFDKDIKTNIKYRAPGILYIDDNANNGWHEIISKMLEGSTIQTVVPDKEYQNDITKLYEEQIKIKINDSISLIMLDLRLYDEDNRSADIQNISGKKLLDIIRLNHKGIPILITTASNKVWSYEELMQAGADAYWIKEGIDNQFDEKESIDNYYRLQWLVDKLTGDEYNFMSLITKKIEKLELSPDIHWFQTMTWNFEYKKNGAIIVPNVTYADKKLIIEILWDGQSFLRSYLKNIVLKTGHENYSNNDWFVPASIIRHLGNIIEIIHDFKTMRDNYHNLRGVRLNHIPDGIKGIDGVYRGNTYSQKFRGDKIGATLYNERNKASHYASSNYFTFYNLKRFFTDLLNYLESKPATINAILETLDEN